MRSTSTRPRSLTIRISSSTAPDPTKPRAPVWRFSCSVVASLACIRSRAVWGSGLRSVSPCASCRCQRSRWSRIRSRPSRPHRDPVRTAELLLAVLIAVAGLVTLARYVRTPYPVLLLIGGLALGTMPGVPRVDVSPDAILVLVLPPIVYVAAFFTPIRSFRANLGNIVSLAIGLVLASTFAVAAVAMAIVPGMTLAIAIALGAIVSPPDEVAALAVIERLAVGRRMVALLQGESLLNDATALTVYHVALGAAIGTTALWGLAPIWQFVVIAAAGIGI